jgi:hypothetical protein
MKDHGTSSQLPFGANTAARILRINQLSTLDNAKTGSFSLEFYKALNCTLIVYKSIGSNHGTSNEVT